jgi:hypothetical protein
MIARWLREPLIQFVGIGALLFIAFEWRGVGPASRRIIITPGQVDAMAAGFARTWQREPADDELKGLIDEYVRDEIATREAMASGLDRDDSVIRRRLRQKWEFVAEDAADAAPPDDAELQRWLDSRLEAFRTEPEVAFEHKMMDGAMPRMLPSDIGRTTRSDLARMFGEEFAAAVLQVQPGTWTGPIESGYGVHQVFVKERIEGRVLMLSEVRTQVEREVVADRRHRRLQEAYQDLLTRYQVVIERRESAVASK